MDEWDLDIPTARTNLDLILGFCIWPRGCESSSVALRDWAGFELIWVD